MQVVVVRVVIVGVFVVLCFFVCVLEKTFFGDFWTQKCCTDKFRVLNRGVYGNERDTSDLKPTMCTNSDTGMTRQHAKMTRQQLNPQVRNGQNHTYKIRKVV